MRWLRPLVTALIASGSAGLGGCFARVNDQPANDGGGADGAGPDGAGPDGAPVLGPWVTATPIPTASVPDLEEDDLTLRSDELELVFAGKVTAGDKDLYVMTRADASAAWSMPTALATLNDATANDQTPRFSPDGLTLYFGSGRAGGLGGDDVYRATRPNVGAAWTAPSPVAVVNTAFADRWYGTCLGGARYVMISNRTGANLNLFEGTLGNAPTAIAPLNSAGADLSPLVDEDCLTMYFSSDGGGDFELYEAARPAIDQPWILGGKVLGLESAAAEQDPWISADRRRMYFAADRDGEFDLYVATR